MALTGCNGAEPDPAPTASATTTVTPTESPTQTPTETPEPTETSALPPLPDEAKENTPEGAEAFIRYYFDVANELHKAPPADVDLDDLVAQECVSCQTMVREIQGLSAADQRTLGPLYIVSSMEPIGGGTPGVQRFNMKMELATVTVETRTSGEQVEVEGRGVEGVGAAIWDGEQWRIYGMDLG